jgi:hypothetical protein
MRLNFETGLDRYYGLLEYGVSEGIIKKEGRKFVMPDGNKYFKQDIENNPKEIFTMPILEELDKAIGSRFSYGSTKAPDNIFSLKTGDSEEEPCFKDDEELENFLENIGDNVNKDLE